MHDSLHKMIENYLRSRMYRIHVTDWHDDVIKWKHFPCYWPFVRGIHRSPVNSPNKGQWRGALMFCLICVWINGWVNRHEAGDLRRYRAHYDVSVTKKYRWCKYSGNTRTLVIVAHWNISRISIEVKINDDPVREFCIRDKQEHGPNQARGITCQYMYLLFRSQLVSGGP